MSYIRWGIVFCLNDSDVDKMDGSNTDKKYCGYPRDTAVHYDKERDWAYHGCNIQWIADVLNLTDEFTNGLARKCSAETFIGELSGVLKSTWSDRGKNGWSYGLYHINIVYAVYGIHDERLTAIFYVGWSYEQPNQSFSKLPSP